MDATGKCPICGKANVEKFRPFCSSRCATLDLGRWLGGEYKVEAGEDAEEGASLPNSEKDEEIG